MNPDYYRHHPDDRDRHVCDVLLMLLTIVVTYLLLAISIFTLTPVFLISGLILVTMHKGRARMVGLGILLPTLIPVTFHLGHLLGRL